MRFGLFFSIAFHGLIIALLVVTLPRSMPDFEMPEIVPVEIVEVAEETNVKAIAEPDPKPEPEPEPEPQPEPQQQLPEPEPEPIVEPDPAPVDEPEPEPEVTPEPAPAPTAEPRAKPTPPKPAPPKKEEPAFDLDRIGVLIDKSKEEKEKEINTPETAPQAEEDQKPRESVGAGTAETMSIAASLRRQIERCYSFPAGAVQPEELIVYVRIRLRPDGTLAEPPVIENTGRMNEPYFRAAAEAAVRAVNQCAPYDLPADRYEDWKEARLNFDPRRMLGM